MRRRAGQSGPHRSRKYVEGRHVPIRVIHDVKRLKPELYHVVLAVRHAELLMYFGVEADDAGSLNGIASDVAELSRGRFDERIEVPVTGRRRVLEVRADTGG